ncbi:MAG TPA: DoxX family protein [Polyangia bacterium]|nr:DoxX family protein [Polyangia bacterium]
MSTIRRHVPTAARLFLGLVFTVFGLNFFLHFLPVPPAPPRAAAFAGALFASGYLFPLLKATEVAAGLLLLSGRFVPLALTLLAPIIVNIVGFHLFLEPSGLPIPLAVLSAELYLAWSYRAAFAPMLRARTPLTERASSLAPAPEVRAVA